MNRILYLIAVALAIFIIWSIDWPKLKQKPLRDRAAFISLLVLGGGLCTLDLKHLPGPTQLLLAVFKPLAFLVKP